MNKLKRNKQTKAERINEDRTTQEGHDGPVTLTWAT